ncbi:MAG: alanine racemase [bacterium]
MAFNGRPVVAEIDLNSLVANISEIKSIVPDKKIIAVVKDNAYGHGSKEVVKKIDQFCDYYGVASVDEAWCLRNCTRKSFFIFGGVFNGDLKHLSKRIIPTVYDFRMLEFLTKLGKAVNVNIEVDTGMGRTGFQSGEIDRLIKQICYLKSIKVYGLMTHFASSDADKSFTTEQIEKFYKIYEKFKNSGIEPKIVHVANSAGIFYKTKPFINAVRPGIMLYGSYPAERLKKKLALKPVMTFKSQIISIKKVPAGTPISYGCTFVTKRESLIATVACGYGDGYPRALSNRGVVYIEGKGLAPVAGRVCMDMFMIDVTGIPDVSVGDSVVLWGKGDENVHPDNIAKLADTISYELFCRVCERIKRVYKD